MLPQLLGGRVSGLRCSTRLGVAKFELGGWTVMVYQNGRIDIRRVKDMVEAGSVVEEVRALISAAFTCTPAYTARS